MKIKTKKRMSPEEYAKYMIDKHGISVLESELIDDNIIDTPKRYALTFELNPVSMKEISDTDFGNKEFTIEVEEEITEDTKLDLIERFIGGKDYVCYTSDENTTIKECLKRSPRDCTTTHFYIENDDRELILIWRDGKLI